MKIVALAENTASRADLKTVHGLSIYIETPKHRLLFDLGPDDTFSDNAAVLGVDLAGVDTVIISHGHYDHGRALGRFFKLNDRATVYMRRQAFEPHFARLPKGMEYNGLDAKLAGHERIVFTDDVMRIDDELFVFSDVDAAHETESSRVLMKQTADGALVQDDFDHEQDLILSAEGKDLLFSGCSHSGIESILAAAYRHHPGLDAVFGGFHLFNPNSGVMEPEEFVRGVAERLHAYDTDFYTCHCTGEKAFGLMRETMGDQLRYLSAGTVVEI